MVCECKRLAKLLATNWSYYKCVDCGEEYFSSGNAKVIWRWYACPKCDRWMIQDRGKKDVYKCSCGYSETHEESRKRQKEWLSKVKKNV